MSAKVAPIETANGGAPSPLPALARISPEITSSNGNNDNINNKGNDNANTMEETDGHHAELTTKSWLPSLIARRPYLVLGASIGLALTFIIIAFVAQPFSISAGGVFYSRSDSVSEMYDAFSVRFDNDPALPTYPQQSDGSAISLSLEYVSKDGDETGNLLTSNIVDAIAKLESDIVSVEGYGDYCLIPTDSSKSVGSAGPGPANCAPAQSIVTALRDIEKLYPSEDTFDKKIAKLAEVASDPPAGYEYMSTILAKTFGESSNSRSWVLRTTIKMGLPFEGFKNSRDKYTDQTDKYAKWVDKIIDVLHDARTGPVDDAGATIYWSGAVILDKEMESILFQDLLLLTMSVFIVFTAMCLQTWSVFLALCGLIQIILCFPLAYFLFRFVLQFEIFTAMNTLGIFVVMGVGADDVFVAVDAWKQSRHEAALLHDIELRFSWVWKRAAKAMLVTSLTTFMAFVATATSSIPTIKTFGVFSALSVLVNYGLVITLFSACIIIYHRNFEYRHCCCCGDKWAEKAPEGTPHAAYGHGDIEAGGAAAKVHSKDLPDQDGDDHTAGHLHNIESYRFTERVFHKKVSPFVHKYRYILLGGFAVLIIASIVGSTFLSPPDTQPSMLPSSHPAKGVIDNMKEHRGDVSDEQDSGLYLAWGYEGNGIKRTTDMNDEENPGEPTFDPNFDCSAKAAQSALATICERLSVDSEYVHATEHICPMLSFKSWIASNTNETFPVPQDQFGSLWLKFSEDPLSVDNLALFSWKNADDKAGEGLKWMAVSFDSSVSRSSGRDVQKDHFKWWNDQIDTFTAEFESTGIGRPILAKDLFVWMRTADMLAGLATTGILTALALAFVVLVITTHNVIAAMISLTALGGIMASTIGTMVLLGMKLGFAEAISVSILGGLSVDFTIHYAVAYIEADLPNRYLKMRQALTDLGISVVGGATTTLSATLLMFFAAFPFFSVFGGFIFLLIAFSFLYANLFLTALLTTVGPVGKFGDWLYYLKSKLKKNK